MHLISDLEVLGSNRGAVQLTCQFFQVQFPELPAKRQPSYAPDSACSFKEHFIFLHEMKFEARLSNKRVGESTFFGKVRGWHQTQSSASLYPAHVCRLTQSAAPNCLRSHYFKDVLGKRARAPNGPTRILQENHLSAYAGREEETRRWQDTNINHRQQKYLVLFVFPFRARCASLKKK